MRSPHLHPFECGDSRRKYIGNIRSIILSLIAVVLLTVLLISGNSMALTVRERIPEVALFRTLGFGRWHIGYLLFAEAVFLGLAGGLC
jgi:putative ABC transport system permease protein